MWTGPNSRLLEMLILLEFRANIWKLVVGSTKGVLCPACCQLKSLQFLLGCKENTCTASSYSEKKIRVILSPFLSCLSPFYQSEAWCSTIQMKMSLTCTRMKSFSYERMGTKTHFGEEAKGNSEMPYWLRCDCLTMKSKWLEELGSFIYPQCYGHWPYLALFARNISKSRCTLTLFGAMF